VKYKIFPFKTKRKLLKFCGDQQAEEKALLVVNA